MTGEVAMYQQMIFVNLPVRDRRSFLDPDGHHWEIMWMDPAAVQG